MGNSKLQKLRDKYKEELEGLYKEGPVEAAKVQLAKDLAKTVYYLGEICCEEDEEGYSQTGKYIPGNSYRGRYSRGRYPMSYDEGRQTLIHRVGDLMMCTMDPQEQNVLREAVERLERM